jgi:hypothetical protein
MKHTHSFIIKCRELYFKGIRPSNPSSKISNDYKELLQIAEDFFSSGKINDFAEYFMEFQYNINLWAAHLILEYGQPSNKLKKECLEIIEQYSKTKMDKELAKEETFFLDSLNKK